MGRFGNFLLGALLGSLVGSAAALLLAPESGEEIRGQLVQYKNDLQREVGEARMQRRLQMELELARLRTGGKEGEITVE
ncbi:MAG TPA: YtxH domain-containing protein [Anaerolineaceae bacterium]|nr:YtxH domain-containing protein [Anaerolineaceae bacterium]